MKKPNEKTCFVREMLEWAASPSTKVRKGSANQGLVTAINDNLAAYEKIHNAYWRHREWIAEEMAFVLSLPNMPKLIIGFDTARGLYVPYSSVKMMRMREAARLLNLKLHHIDFKYFTVG
jgi:hypothetical protein